MVSEFLTQAAESVAYLLGLLQNSFLLWVPLKSVSLSRHLIYGLEQYSHVSNSLPSEPREVPHALHFILHNGRYKIQEFVLYCGEDILNLTCLI